MSKSDSKRLAQVEAELMAMTATEHAAASDLRAEHDRLLRKRNPGSTGLPPAGW